MKKAILTLLIVAALGMATFYVAVKNDLHKSIFGESKITDYIESLRSGYIPLTPGLVGKTAPDFTLPSATGGVIKLSDYDGQLTLINFWAPWCPPCLAEIPGFMKIQEEYRDKGLSIIGIALEDKKAVKRYINDVKLNYSTAYGSEDVHAIAGTYGNPSGALPYSILIGKDRKILAIFMGFLSETKLKELIENHL